MNLFNTLPEEKNRKSIETIQKGITGKRTPFDKVRQRMINELKKD